MTENGHGTEAEARAGNAEGTEANQGSAETKEQPGEPGVDRPPTEDEIRAAEKAAVNIIYELRVYAECGGPEPREHGCGHQLWLNDGRSIQAALHGGSMIVKCKGCGMFNRLAPPKAPQQQMVQPVGPNRLQRRIMDAMSRHKGLVGPN